jgi:hypothetical protein
VSTHIALQLRARRRAPLRSAFEFSYPVSCILKPASCTMLRRLAPHLLIFSATSTLLWWLALWLWPAFQVFFMPRGAPAWVLWSFLLPDILLLVALPLYIAHLLRRSSRRAWPLLCVHCGSVVYATLMTIALCVWSHSAWLGAFAMTMLSGFTIMLTLAMRPSRD